MAPDDQGTEELKCIAAALSDLPAPTDTSVTMPLTQAQYMAHTLGLVIEHFMQKMYEKGDLELKTKFQGALDEDSFMNGFKLKALHFSTTLKYSDTLPDIGPSNSKTIDWTVWGNSGDADLTEAYMTQILTGLNGGTPQNAQNGDQPSIDLAAAVQARYAEIFERTSELTDCANRDKASYLHSIGCSDHFFGPWIPD